MNFILRKYYRDILKQRQVFSLTEKHFRDLIEFHVNRF
jgi:hypothetical protein